MIDIQKLTPMYDKIIVLPVKEKEETGGFVVPDTAKERPRKGYVVAVGPGVDGQKMQTIPGDLILFGRFSGSEAKIDTETYLVMRDTPQNNDVIAVLERPTAYQEVDENGGNTKFNLSKLLEEMK